MQRLVLKMIWIVIQVVRSLTKMFYKDIIAFLQKSVNLNNKVIKLLMLLLHFVNVCPYWYGKKRCFQDIE